MSHNTLLQTEFNEYGEDAYVSDVVEYSPDPSEDRERIHINLVPDHLTLNIQKRGREGDALKAHRRLKKLRGGFYNRDGEAEKAGSRKIKSPVGSRASNNA